MARRLPEDPLKRRLQVFKRTYQHLEHWKALMEDRGMEPVITDPESGEDIYINDLLVGRDSLPPRQRQAFDLICLRGYTETAARDILLPNSKSSTPVQQYADSGLIRMIQAYDLYQLGQWPPAEPLKPPKKKSKIRKALTVMALHPIVRQHAEAAKKKILAEMEGLKIALKQVDEILGASSESEIPTTNGHGSKPDLQELAKQVTADALNK